MALPKSKAKPTKGAQKGQAKSQADAISSNSPNTNAVRRSPRKSETPTVSQIEPDKRTKGVKSGPAVRLPRSLQRQTTDPAAAAPAPPPTSEAKRRTTTGSAVEASASRKSQLTNRKSAGTAAASVSSSRTPSPNKRKKTKPQRKAPPETSSPAAKKSKITGQSEQQQKPRGSSSDSPAPSSESSESEEEAEESDATSMTTMTSVPSTPVIIGRYKQPRAVDKEIRFFQRTTHALIPRLPFCRLVREITTDITGAPDIRYKGAALAAIQEATESYLIGLMEDSNLLCYHAKRVTLLPNDIRLAYRLRRD